MAGSYLQNIRKIYFLGIGGISMSGLAIILRNKGYLVSGSDSKASDMTDSLSQKGIQVFIGQKSENISSDIDLAVYTAAISEDNPEIQEIRRKGIDLIPRSKLLGIIMSQFGHSVAVAGTHGKTTTTSMISQILINASYDPTISIGGLFPQINSNVRIGDSDYFITEACEYTNSFLELEPTVAIILNVELDHIDYFKNMGEVFDSFKGFVSNIQESGAAVIYSGIENFAELTSDKNVITFGFNESDNWRAANLTQKKDITEFELFHNNRLVGTAKLPLPGVHNVVNALGACAASHFLGVSEETILATIEEFCGTKRRFEFKGEKNGVLVFDDYAHHPSEIKATLEAARGRFRESRIICVFQPHTYSRTKAFLEEFSQSFEESDEVILANIYAAREKDPGDISSNILMEKIKGQNKEARYCESFDKIAEYLANGCGTGDIVITMGAGDIYLVGEEFLEMERGTLV